MASASELEYLQFVTQELNLYIGLFIFITGILGESLNIIVFSTLKTFRQTACSSYLVTNSIANIVVLIVLLLRVVYDGFNASLSYTSMLCKFRYFLTYSAGLISFTAMCLATIDQFLSMTKYNCCNNLRFARRIIVFMIIFWILCSIPALIYYDVYLTTCVTTNEFYNTYVTYFYTPVVYGCLPELLMIIFAMLAFYKMRTLDSRRIPVVRLSRDRQLTAMTLIYTCFMIFLIAPFLIVAMCTLIINTRDTVEIIRLKYMYAITVLIYYTNHSCSFYIYYCVSKRFRKQVRYVLFDIYLERLRHRVHKNQITPDPTTKHNASPTFLK